MAPPNVNREHVLRRIGRKIREARKEEGLTLVELGEEMRALGLPWTQRTVTGVQIGATARELHINELIALSYVLRRRLEWLALDEPISMERARAGRPRIAPLRLAGAVGIPSDGMTTEMSERMTQWHPAPGQKQRLAALAERMGVSQASLIRQAVEALLDHFDRVHTSEPQEDYGSVPPEELAKIRKRLGKWGLTI